MIFNLDGKFLNLGINVLLARTVNALGCSKGANFLEKYYDTKRKIFGLNNTV